MTFSSLRLCSIEFFSVLFRFYSKGWFGLAWLINWKLSHRLIIAYDDDLLHRGHRGPDWILRHLRHALLLRMHCSSFLIFMNHFGPWSHRLGNAKQMPYSHCPYCLKPLSLIWNLWRLSNNVGLGLIDLTLLSFNDHLQLCTLNSPLKIIIWLSGLTA